MQDDGVAGIHAMEQIRQLKARYCRFVDTKQWLRLKELFTVDARFEGLGSAPAGCDRDAFIAGVASRLEACISVHHCHTPEIRLTGPDAARAIWAMCDYLEWPEPLPLREAPGRKGFTGYGYYEEAYRREGGAAGGIWKIAFLRLVRLRVDPLPEGRPSAGPGVRPTLLGPAASAADWLASRDETAAPVATGDTK